MNALASRSIEVSSNLTESETEIGSPLQFRHLTVSELFVAFTDRLSLVGIPAAVANTEIFPENLSLSEIALGAASVQSPSAIDTRFSLIGHEIFPLEPVNRGLPSHTWSDFR